MACKLSEKQIIALAKYVTSALENAKPETLNPNFTMDLMKNLYDSIVAKTGDAVNALDYIQHIPTSILAVSGANPEYFTKLVGAGVDINKLTLTMKEFEDVDNVKKAMTGNVKLEEIKNEIVWTLPSKDAVSCYDMRLESYVFQISARNILSPVKLLIGLLRKRGRVKAIQLKKANGNFL